jgi:hypothetical protein
VTNDEMAEEMAGLSVWIAKLEERITDHDAALEAAQQRTRDLERRVLALCPEFEGDDVR